MPIARYLECLRHARIYDLLGAVHASKPRPLKFATFDGSAGGPTCGKRAVPAACAVLAACTVLAAFRTRGFVVRPGRFRAGWGTLMTGAGSEALARIRS